MKTKLLIIVVVVFFNYIIIGIVKTQYNRIVVSQPEYNHIVKIDTCRVVTDTLGKLCYRKKRHFVVQFVVPIIPQNNYWNTTINLH